MKKTLLIILTLYVGIASAADLVVNESGLTGTYTTISSAVNAANTGDRILVSAQSFPYAEDTIHIDKGVTILPYDAATYIQFEGIIYLKLDSIETLTMIGFRKTAVGSIAIYSDSSSSSSLSTINIIDCQLDEILLLQPKTVLNLFYSEVTNDVRFLYGKIIGNKLDNLYLNFATPGSNGCEMFEEKRNFGNVPTETDTIYIIANEGISGSNFNIYNYNERFTVHILNNRDLSIDWYFFNKHADNLIVNNDFANTPQTFHQAFCGSSPSGQVWDRYILADSDDVEEFDFSKLCFINNSSVGGTPFSETTIIPFVTSLTSSLNRPDSLNIKWYYNDSNGGVGDWYANWVKEGPLADNNLGSPSSEYLNLDLTPNIIGSNGGSHAWENYHPTNPQGKARIAWLNLPTRMFDPASIEIKAKAIHTN